MCQMGGIDCEDFFCMRVKSKNLLQVLWIWMGLKLRSPMKIEVLILLYQLTTHNSELTHAAYCIYWLKMTLDKNKIKKVITPIKPSTGKRIWKIDIKHLRIPGVPEAFLNAPIPDWTDPAQLVKEIMQIKMDKNTADNDALE